MTSANTMIVSNNNPRFDDEDRLIVDRYNSIDAEEFGDLHDHNDFVADPDYLRRMLREYGAWSEEELRDHEENLRRLYWLVECHFDEQENLVEMRIQDGPDDFYFSIV